MGKKKSLWRKNRYGAWYKLKEPEGKKTRFIPCDEGKQVFSWARTNKKATENFNGGPTGAIWQEPRGPVHEYLNRDKEEKTEQEPKEQPEGFDNSTVDNVDDYPF